MTATCKAQNSRVLIVDDLSTLRKVLRKLLVELGFETIDEAGDGQDAWEKLQQSAYDLVISDWEMPRMTGLELVEKMRTDAGYKETAFIMITSNRKKDFVVAAAKAGVSDYISKPFSAEILKAKITKVVPEMFAGEPPAPVSEPLP
jgi:two-component system chemotaxis response regulator CheY